MTSIETKNYEKDMPLTRVKNQDYQFKQMQTIVENEIYLKPDFLTEAEADSCFTRLLKTTAWQEETLFIYGRFIKVPRLMSWHGDAQAVYCYSGKTHNPLPWTSELLELKQLAEDFAQSEFNSVLLNLYRNGADSMSWHSDDEKELGDKPLIASLTLGAVRDFQLRHRRDKNHRLNLQLPHGSLLLMKNTCQQSWQHQLPKRQKVTRARINLTFRLVQP